MLEWFKSLPKTMFVTVVLVGGVLFIVLSDPPRTVCDSQMEKFKESAKGFLLVDPKRPAFKTTRYAKLVATCKASNSSGGCYELFMGLKQTIKDSQTISQECVGKLGSQSEFTAAVWQSLDLMVRLAWGEKPPLTSALKAGWFDPADLNLYCELKKVATDERIYSKGKWNGFAEGYFKSLPGASALPRNEAWSRMLLSVNCKTYL